MSRDHESLSQTIDADLRALAPRFDAPLPPAASRRIRAAVAAAAAARSRRAPWLPLAPLAAAAALLAALAPLPLARPLAAPPVDPDQALLEWSMAYAASADRVAMLYGDELLPDDAGEGDEDAADYDAIDSFEESMDTFEHILGA